MMQRLARYILACGLLLVCLFVQADDMQLNVLQLHNRTADYVIPLVEPVLPEGSVVKGSGYNLVVKTTPQGLRELRGLLKQLDKAAQMLQISVRRVHNDEYDTQTAALGKVKVYGTKGADQRDSSQTLLVQSGQTAFIKTGEEFPVRDRGFSPYGPYRHTWYKQLQSGFYVTPRVRGRQAVLNISWQHENLPQQYNHNNWERQQGPVKSESASTSIAVPIGEWTRLGNTSSRQSQTDDRIVYDTANLKHPDSNIFIKVDLVNQ